MALRNIFVKGDDILRKTAREVKEVTERITILLDDMKETMESENGVGIAAPQVGISRRVCIAAPSTERYFELINPVILSSEGEQISQEGCLSVPNYVGSVKRPQKITVKYIDRNGEYHQETFEDFEAIVISHEMDHLDGILYTDKAIDIHEITTENGDVDE